MRGCVNFWRGQRTTETRGVLRGPRGPKNVWELETRHKLWPSTLIKDSTHKNVHLTLGLGHRHLNTCQAPQIQPPETMPGNLTLWKSCLEWCIAGMSGPLHHSVRVCVHVVQSSAKVAKTANYTASNYGQCTSLWWSQETRVFMSEIHWNAQLHNFTKKR